MARRIPKPVLTAIIVDPYASSMGTREEEIAGHVEWFEEQLKRKLDYYTPSMFYDTEIKPGTQLILFDYGGMGIGTDLLADNSRRLVRWAIDNPNTLVMIVSRFTFNCGIRHELMDAGFRDPEGLYGVNIVKGVETAPLLPNVVERDYLSDHPIPEWFLKGLDDADRRPTRKHKSR